MQPFRVADHDRAAPGFHNSFRLEGLDRPAGVAAAYAQERRQLLMGQGYDDRAIGAVHRRDDPFRGSLLDE